MFQNAKYIGAIAVLLLLACNTTKKEPLLIDFSADSTKIIIKNIDPAGLLQLRNHLASDTSYQKIVTVMQTPTDQDSLGREIIWPGKLSLSGSELVYIPEKAFKKGKAYLIETIINTRFATDGEILTADVGHQLKSHQKTLLR